MGTAETLRAGRDHDLIGLPIIRAWTEPGSSGPLRAEVRLTTDVSTGVQPLVTLCRPDDVTSMVSAWPEEVTGPTGS